MVVRVYIYVYIHQVRAENGRRCVRQHVLTDASSSRAGLDRRRRQQYVRVLQYAADVQRMA